jgi:hypothetical protein
MEGEAYAERIDLILGAGLAAATYAPELILKRAGPCDSARELVEGAWNSTGALPDFVQDDPDHIWGRGGSGLTLSALAGPIGLSVTALAIYGSGIQAAQRNDVLQGMLLGAY